MAKFECDGCGGCEKFTGEKEVKIEHTGPFYTVAGGKFVGLPLYGWEARRFRKIAPNVKLLPQVFLVDKKGKRLIVLKWVVASERCPLYTGEKCGDYESRSLVCKSFPVLNCGFESIQLGGKFLPKSSKICPQAEIKKIPRPPTTAQAIREYASYWGDCYLYAVANMRAELALKKMAAVLENAPEVEYLSGLEKEDVLALVEGGKWVDLLELYSQMFKVPEEETKRFIEDLESLEEARKGIERTATAVGIGGAS